MVLGTGMARWMCAVPSASKVVYGSVGTDWDCARTASAAGRASREENDLLVMMSLAHVADVIRPVHLNKKPVRIPEFERFLRPAGLHFQIACFQFCQNTFGVKSRDSKIVVIEGRAPGFLLNAEEALTDAQNVRLFRVLPKRQSEAFLVEL